MNLMILYLLLAFALLAVGAGVGMHYAQAYVQAIHKGATPDWSTALTCARAVGGWRIKPMGLPWDFGYLMVLLGWAAMSQSSLVKAFFIILLMPLLIALWRIDKHSYLLPDALLIGVLLLGLAYAYAEGALVSRLVFALCVYLILRALCWGYERFTSKPSMGAGDNKLIAVFCLWLGAEYLLAFIAVATLLLLATALLQAKKKRFIAFGPFLIMAGVLMLALSGSISA